MRIRRREIRESQIKYARTPLTCINEEGMSTVVMTKDLELPCESGIKNMLLERLITGAHIGSYLSEHADTHILCETGQKRDIRSMLGGFITCGVIYIIIEFVEYTAIHRDTGRLEETLHRLQGTLKMQKTLASVCSVTLDSVW